MRFIRTSKQSTPKGKAAAAPTTSSAAAPSDSAQFNSAQFNSAQFDSTLSEALKGAAQDLPLPSIDFETITIQRATSNVSEFADVPRRGRPYWR